MIELGQLTMDVENAQLTGDPKTEIEALEYDSRQVKPGTLFFAVKGFKSDGYDFVSQALANGAVAVMGERADCSETDNHVSVNDIRSAMASVAAKFYDFPGEKLKVCGVTGTNGKTTTCYLIKKILEARNKTTGLITSQIYDTGKETFEAERTTPESLDLQRLLYLMKKNHCVNAVVEASSHALALSRLEHVNFRVAVFTNLTRDHLDFHKDMEAYLAAKAILLEKLDGPLSYAVINLDVPEFRVLFGELKSSFMSYSIDDTSADVYCPEFEMKPDGCTFNLVSPMGSRTVQMKLTGKFNLYNALAAATAGLASGVDIDNVVQGLESAEAVPGRFEPINAGQPYGLIVDFAHTPDALQRLCEAAREMTRGRLLLLFGCGGDRDKGKRELMGKIATEFADQVIITSDNPRSEEPSAIAENIKAGISKDNYQVILDRAEAVRAILEMANENDTVLLAGKGAEKYQEIGNERQDYSDSSEAHAFLAKQTFPKATGEES